MAAVNCGIKVLMIAAFPRWKGHGPSGHRGATQVPALISAPQGRAPAIIGSDDHHRDDGTALASKVDMVFVMRDTRPHP